MYQTNSAALDRFLADMETNCGSSVQPTTYCVLAAENALDSDLSFLTSATDASVPPRFSQSNGLLVRGLSHGARGIYLRIVALRDRSVEELGTAENELSLARQLRHSAFEALPSDVETRLGGSV